MADIPPLPPPREGPRPAGSCPCSWSWSWTSPRSSHGGSGEAIPKATKSRGQSADAKGGKGGGKGGRFTGGAGGVQPVQAAAARIGDIEAPIPGQLFPNQFVNVRMVIDALKGVVVVPTAAIQRGSQLIRALGGAW